MNIFIFLIHLLGYIDFEIPKISIIFYFDVPNHYVKKNFKERNISFFP
jgi:hypothetical protein